MPNLLWYILIGVISCAICSFTIYKKKDIYRVSTLIVFYFSVAGTTWVGEFIVLGLFNSYVYETGVYENPWAQNLLGHLILNTTIYPSLAIVMVVFSLSWGWIIPFTALFLFIEYIFIWLGLYEQHWWKYYMTAIVVIVYLSVSKYWFSKIIQKPAGAARTFVFYFAALVIIHLPTPVLLLSGKLHYQAGLVNKHFVDFYLSSIIVAFVHHLFISFVMTLFVCILERWYWKVVPFAVSLLCLTTYAKIGILVIDNGWKLIYYLLIQQMCIATFVLIERYTLKTDAI